MSIENPVGWFEIYVSDTARSKTFYEAVLGLELQRLEQSGESLSDMWAFPMHSESGGATGALAKMDGAPIGPGGTIVYFVVPDCGTSALKVVQSGGRIVKSKFSIGKYGNIALAA